MIEDVNFFIGDTWINPTTASSQQLMAAPRGTLTFTAQKNGVRGEIIGLGTSSDALVCPVRAAVRCLLDLRRHGAPAGTPLARVLGLERSDGGQSLDDKLQ